jgi:1-aminocyclopropane-1-carboxylate deaminase
MPVDISISKPPIEPLHCALLRLFDVSVNVLRLDKCHPLLSGNKWYKLKYNLLEFQQQPELPILSFGGAYSNHLHALAAAGKLFGMRTIGVVRGEMPAPLNPVLTFAREQGMTLLPVSRSNYRRKHEADFLQDLRDRFGDFHLLPEGGSNSLAIKGCEEIASLLEWQNTDLKRLVALCCGTGTTMAGLISGLSKTEADSAPEVLGISVLKGDGYLQSEVLSQLQACDCSDPAAWRVDDAHHCGGYARSNPALQSFLNEFAGFSDMPLEPVYTGKLFYALFDLIEKGVIPAGTEIVAIHSGGIHN